MGYRSTITKFDQFEFKLEPGVTSDEITRRLTALDPEYAEELLFWFDLEIHEDSSLELVPVGEEGKAYNLEPLLQALISVLKDLQSPEDSSGLLGLRFRFELWGEEPGDATLYSSDGKQLLASSGVMSFPGELKPVL